MWLGALLVALGIVGATAAARFVPYDQYEARRSQLGPLVASALPRFPMVPLQRVCPPPGDAHYYYPSGTFPALYTKGVPRPARLELRSEDDNSWTHYPDYLSTMREPPLWCGSPGIAESYRFLLAPSFRDAACVRIERHGSKVRLRAALLSVTGGSVFESVDKALDAATWNDVLVRVNAANFWEDLASYELTGPDGARWVLEGRRNGFYKIVDVYEPANQAFAAVGIRFLELARMSTALR